MPNQALVLPNNLKQEIRKKAVQKACSSSADVQMSELMNPRIDHRIKHLVNDPKHRGLLVKRIHELSFFMGLKEPMESEMVQLHISFLEMNFPEMSWKQILQAFMLAAAGKLEANPQHYGVFSPQYVGSILSTYQTRSNKLRVRIREIETKFKYDELNRMKAQSFDWVAQNEQNLLREFQSWQSSKLEGKKYSESLASIDIWLLEGMFAVLPKTMDVEKMCKEFNWTYPTKGGDESDLVEFAQSLFLKINVFFSDVAGDVSDVDKVGMFYERYVIKD
jgi:hypothetical protein